MTQLLFSKDKKNYSGLHCPGPKLTDISVDGNTVESVDSFVYSHRMVSVVQT